MRPADLSAWSAGRECRAIAGAPVRRAGGAARRPAGAGSALGQPGRQLVEGRDRRPAARVPVRGTNPAAGRAPTGHEAECGPAAARHGPAGRRVPRPARPGGCHARRQRQRRCDHPDAHQQRRALGRAGGARLLRGVRQLPARPDRQDARTRREAPAHFVRAGHSADAGPAAASAPERVRMADQTR